MRKSIRYIVITCVAAFAVAGCAGETAVEGLEATEPVASGPQAPMFEVDPLWPKPLPNHWILGSTIGVSVDSRDHIWVIHRQTTFNANTEIGATADPPIGVCCVPAPNVLEFDQEGNLVSYWGGPGEGYEWPASNHGITVDYMDNVWIGGNGEPDAHLLKFARDGTFLMQLGRSGGNAGSNDLENFGRVAKISVDPNTNEAYIADGYLNKRVAVIDASTGEFKRYWGAYGNMPDDTDLGPYDPDAPPAQQFRTPVHCAEISNDNFVYVCDRVNNRIQQFQTDGTFVDEVIIAPQTLGAGSAWDLTFSRDPEQAYIYMVDGVNEKVYIIQRDTLEVLTSFGDGGRYPGQFFGVHSVATDAAGNIYTTETYEGKRLQKFVYMGMGPVTEQDQGVVWPE